MNRVVAQFGSALDWGSRGREFKSRHSDHSRQNLRLTIVIRRFCRLLSNYIKLDSYLAIITYRQMPASRFEEI